MFINALSDSLARCSLISDGNGSGPNAQILSDLSPSNRCLMHRVSSMVDLVDGVSRIVEHFDSLQSVNGVHQALYGQLKRTQSALHIPESALLPFPAMNGQRGAANKVQSKQRQPLPKQQQQPPPPAILAAIGPSHGLRANATATARQSIGAAPKMNSALHGRRLHGGHHIDTAPTTLRRRGDGHRLLDPGRPPQHR